MINNPPAAKMPYRKAHNSFSKSACSPLRTTKVPSMAATIPAPASSMGNTACESVKLNPAPLVANATAAAESATAEMMLPT